MRIPVALLLSLSSRLCLAQAQNDRAMTLDDLRQYFEVMHIRDADQRGVQVQMDAQKAKLPPWWPEAMNGAMLKSMLEVDLPAIEYPFVKSCMSSADTHAFIALFSTPEGQLYVKRATGGMVEAEANGVAPSAAKQEQVQKDEGIPKAALERLTPDQRRSVMRSLQGGAVGCMNTGFQKASVAVGQARTEAVNKLLDEHRPELQAAKAKYDAAGSNSETTPKE